MKQWKKDIEIECLRTTLKDVIVIFPNMVITDEHIRKYIKMEEDNDKNNHVILTVRKAIDLTEKRFQKDLSTEHAKIKEKAQ